MKTATVEINLPDGFELAELKVRVPIEGEWCLIGGSAIRAWADFGSNEYPILRKVDETNQEESK